MTFVDDKALAINALVSAVEAVETELGIAPSGPYSNVRARLDIIEARGNNTLLPFPSVDNPFIIGAGAVTISTGSGLPSSSEVAGSLYLRTDGYNYQGLYSRRTDGYWHAINTEPYTYILDGYAAAGAQFYCTSQITAANLTFEDGKSYDMSIRVLVNNTSGTPTCARYIFDVLAHCESGTLTLDVNTATPSANGTGWTVTLSATSNQLRVSVDAVGILDRKAYTTVTWRELSRLQLLRYIL